MKSTLLSLLLVGFVVGTNFAFAQVDTITILHVNDTHSNLAAIGPRSASLQGTQGGIARAASLIGMLQMTNPNVLTLHAGDLFIGDLFFNVYFGVPELQMLHALGFDAMAVGNHEFDLTPATLRTALDSAFVSGGFPLLSANLNLDHPDVQYLRNYIHPYTIRDFDSVRVGIFGMTTPATNILSLPAPAFVDSNIVQIAAAMVDTLSALNCDVIICLSHLGVSLDRVIASYVPGINAIVGGHDHYLFTEPERVVNPLGDTTYIVQANAFYLNLGKLRLTVGNEVRFLDYEAIAINELIPEEPTIAATVSYLVAGIEAIYGPVYTQRIGYATAFFEEVADSLMDNGYKDTPIGNLVTDAFRAVTGTDIAIEVGGSTAQPLYQGPVVAADAFHVVGYGFNTINGLGYRLATFHIVGAYLLAGIEFGLSTIEENDEFLAQVSGMAYAYNPSAPPFARVTSATVGGVPLDPSATYSVTANEFVPLFLDYLGIPYSNLRILTDTTEFQVLANYITLQDTISPYYRQSILSPVRLIHEGRPETFELMQNYPNPFNPSTEIFFAVPRESFVALNVYNVIGQEIATLVDSELKAGSYRVTFNAMNIASGVYFYKLQTEDFTATKKMVLMK